MTISIAWTRKDRDIEQLVFVSDSRISAGEKFDACPKMLSLPRRDCGISYAGTSGDALSMMLQLSLAVESYPPAMRRTLEIPALRTHAVKIFNEMLNEIRLDQIIGGASTRRTDAEFLFGGYSWRKKSFELSSICYTPAQNRFAAHRSTRLSVDLKNRRISRKAHPTATHRPIGQIAYAGDQSKSAEKLVMQKLSQKLKEGHDLTRLHMEPFEAVRDLLRNRSLRNMPDKDSIGGAPQMMKIFQYSQSAPFAFFWPDNSGKLRPFLHGRPCLDYENLNVMCLDPDTLEGVYLGAERQKPNEVDVEGRIPKPGEERAVKAPQASAEPSL